MENSLMSILRTMDKGHSANEILPVLLTMLTIQRDENMDVLANLVAMIDNDTLVNLLQVFEGCTIKFPTLKEYRIMMLALMVIYEKQLLDKTYSGVLDSLSETEYKEVLETYSTLMSNERFKATLKEMAVDADKC